MPTVIKVQFSTTEELEKTYSEQISKGGYFVPSDQPLPRGTPVEIHFSLPGLPEPLVVRAEVAFAAPASAPIPGLGAGMALQFERLFPQINTAFRAALTVAKAEGFDLNAAATVPPQQPEEKIPPSSTAPSEGKNSDAPATVSDEIPLEGDGGEESGEEEEEAIDEAALADENLERDVITQLSQQSSENLYYFLRRLPLHKKIIAAKRGNRSVRAILLQEGQKKVMLFLLQNPQLGAAEVIQMLKLPNLSLEILQQIAKNSVFNQNEEIRYLLAIHPKTPLPMALNLLNSLNLNHLAKIAKSGLKAQLKSAALRLLEQRRK